MKVNYHTHTKRCKHAVGEDEEYVLAAIKGGFKVLGFSDHTPWAYKSDFVPRIRMTMDQFGEYCASIHALKEKYADQTKIIISQKVRTIKNADVIIVLKNGKIAEMGKHNELVKHKGLYNSIYESQESSMEK